MITPRVASLVAALCLSAALAFASGARAQSTNPLLELVTDEANGPVYVADPGDGRLFVVELTGHVRILLPSGHLQDPSDAFLTLGDVDLGSGGEGGLHSMAFDPQFASNRRFFVAYTRAGSGGSPLESVIASYQADPNDPSHAVIATRKEVLTYQAPVGAQFDNHKGGQLQFGPDDMLYFAFGDGGSQDDPGCRSQTRNLLYGKMLRIDPNGSDPSHPNYGIPAGNPFENDPNLAPEVWALGFRNPFRFSFDREKHDLWIGDVGGSIREEIDMEPWSSNRHAGLNYGWKVEEGTTCHIQNPQAAGCPAYVAQCGDPSYTPPLFDYVHGGGDTVIGGYVYRGSISAWQGRYIFADFGRSDIYALVEKNGTWERLLLSDNDLSQPVSFGEDHNGELYVAALDGTVHRLRFDRLAQSKAETSCIVKLNQGFAKLADTDGKLVGACVAKAASGKLAGGDVEACVSGDPKLAKLADKNLATEAKQCTVPPTFGYSSAAIGNAASDASDLALAHDVFGADLDAAVVTKSADKDAAACQKAVLAGMTDCQRARRAEFVRCKTDGLKKTTILNQGDLATCLASDPKGKVAKVCDGATGKLATKTIDKSCTSRGVDLATAFPGCSSGPLAQCIDQNGVCETCLMFREADALAGDACADVCE